MLGYAGGIALTAAGATFGFLYLTMRAHAGWDPPWEISGGVALLYMLTMFFAPPLVGFGLYSILEKRIDGAIHHGTAAGAFLGSTVGITVGVLVGLVALGALAFFAAALVMYYMVGLAVVAAIGKAVTR